MIEQLEELLNDPPEWDSYGRYTPDNINVYFEDKDKRFLHKVDVHQSLGQILQHER